MSVQNLREKFNQPNGAPSAPGVSFGAAPKLSPVGLKTPSAFVENKSPIPFKLQVRQSPSPEKETTPQTADPVVVNGFRNNCFVNVKRNPEQYHQDIILKKWNHLQSSPAESEESKIPINRFTTQLTLDRNGSSDNVFDNPADRTEKMKNVYESNTNKSNGFGNTNGNSFKVSSSFTNEKFGSFENESLENRRINLKPVTNGFKEDRWKAQTPENDIKKNIFQKSTSPEIEVKKSFQTVSKTSPEYSSLEKRFKIMQKERDEAVQHLKEKDEQLVRLRKVSEAMYKEYDQLKNQYEIETNTMQQAMQRATQWYKQNRELKRRSSALVQQVMMDKPEFPLQTLDDVDTSSSEDAEIEELRNTIKEFTKQVSQLQAELKSVSVRESEAQDQIAELNNALEKERRARQFAESKVKVDGQYSLFDQQKTDEIMKEICTLRDSMCKLQSSTCEEIYKLKEKIVGVESNNPLESIEEKLKVTENELTNALQRTAQAESETNALFSRVTALENELTELKSNKTPMSAPPPPPPPPPPPLPPTPPSGLSKGLIIRKSASTYQRSPEGSAADEVADMLGIAKKPKPVIPGGAIDDIINEIKGGRFTLKTIEKQNSAKKEQEPPVVHEMINILGTLRRQPKKHSLGQE